MDNIIHLWDNQMDVEPNDLLLFARIVEAGSFSQAALRVDLPKSTVSRRISLLEAKLGERLLQRTTRKLMVTEFGASLLEHARKVVEEVEAAGALVQHRQLAPSGKLRISMPGDFANLGMSTMIAHFIERYPAVTLELDLSPRRVDLVAKTSTSRSAWATCRTTLAQCAPGGAGKASACTPRPATSRGAACPSIRTICSSTICCACQPQRRQPSWTLTRGKVVWERRLPAR
jgi:molybdenum-dependent DNA-binding transcriptional regulator ModE